MKQYDSLFQGKLTPSLEHQIAQLYSCAAQNGMIKVKAVPMQQQTGSTDCGLFSIAAAVHVALGDSMADTSFAQEKLRDHLIHCFQQQQISFFPTAETSSKNKLKHLFVHLYCTCLMPVSYNTRMIQCDRCEHWFHFGLNTKKSPSTWLCSACK